jgi:hypothetical protein
VSRHVHENGAAERLMRALADRPAALQSRAIERFCQSQWEPLSDGRLAALRDGGRHAPVRQVQEPAPAPPVEEEATWPERDAHAASSSKPRAGEAADAFLPRGRTATRPATAARAATHEAAGQIGQSRGDGVTQVRGGPIETTTALEPSSMLDAILARARGLQRNGTLELRFTLRPEDLGPVRVRIESRGEQLRIRIVAASGSAIDTLSSGLPRLAAHLQEAGFRDADVDLQLDDTSAGQAGHERQSAAARRSARHAHPVRDSADKPVDKPAPVRAPSSRLDRVA